MDFDVTDAGEVMLSQVGFNQNVKSTTHARHRIEAATRSPGETDRKHMTVIDYALLLNNSEQRMLSTKDGLARHT